MFLCSGILQKRVQSIEKPYNHKICVEANFFTNFLWMKDYTSTARIFFPLFGGIDSKKRMDFVGIVNV